MYEQEFVEALDRTVKFGLKAPEVKTSTSMFLTQEALSKLPQAIYDEIGELNEEEVVAQCLSLHKKMLPVIEKIFKTKAYFTIGWISLPERTMYHQTEDSLREMLRNGIKGPSVSLHAWITLPSMEILDFSLPTSYARINGIKEGLYGAVTLHPSQLTGGMMYKPMLVGDDFLLKIGALKFILTPAY